MAVINCNCKYSKCGKAFNRPASYQTHEISALDYCSRDCYMKDTTGRSLKQIQQRNERICKRVAAGEHPTAVGKDFNVSRQRVLAIVKRNSEKVGYTG